MSEPVTTPALPLTRDGVARVREQWERKRGNMLALRVACLAYIDVLFATIADREAQLDELRARDHNRAEIQA